jgi:sigma-B regulation protein RsbU (phosphoserine phosphatase)
MDRAEQSHRSDREAAPAVDARVSGLAPRLEAVRAVLQPRLVGTIWGRVLLVAGAAKLLAAVTSAIIEPTGLIALLDGLASLALVLVALYGLGRLFGVVKRRLLWRVRRKLILSYVFIGFVPAILIAAFFLGVGLLTFLNLSSYLLKNGIEDFTEQARILASDVALEIAASPDPREAQRILATHQSSLSARLPDASLAVVPTPWAQEVASPMPPASVGPWWHLDPPRVLPDWVSLAGFGGLLAYTSGDADETALVIRATGVPEIRDPAFAVIVDLPLDDDVAARLREKTGIELRSVGVVPIGGESVGTAAGRRRTVSEIVSRSPGSRSTFAVSWVTFTEYVDWETGRTGTVGVSTDVGIADLWEQISQSETRLGNVNLGDMFLLALVLIGGLFLVIELIALYMGYTLARSITGSVHALFLGTERVRAGDFSHRIRVKVRDQLGELGDSFNSMTASIEDLLQQADVKKRLQEELRIARKVQMSLLPNRPLELPGVSITTLCEPAREVGGDYFDFFPLSDRRAGLLIADVSGKGTSAAFYMAELKGLLLSMSQIYESPRQLLIEVNRALSQTLDNRTFITMTYAILDLDARTLVYARAGHTPLIHLPAGNAGARHARVLIPNGMVVGLQFDDSELKFSELLEEHQLTVSRGDILVFYTDGISEAMNEASDLFGEERLSRLIEEHAELSSGELRERILREIKWFVAGADQHDDMTMIVVKIVDLDRPGLHQPGPTAIAV